MILADERKRTVEAGYDALADRFGEWMARVEGDPWERYMVELAGRLPAGARVLDLGCGNGAKVSRLADRFDVTGVDISERQLELARTAAPGAAFLQADFTELEFSANAFDAVTALYSLVHVPREEQPGLLGRILRWLKPGGLFLASMSHVGGEDRTDEWLGVEMFFSGFDAETNRRLVREAGFELLADDLVWMREPEGDAAFLWGAGEEAEVRRADATRLYYVLQVLLYMPTWVVMAVYLVRELNLSPLELILMGTAMEAAVFLFEVPTGVVADTYSRRLSLIVGYIGMGVAWMAVALVSSPGMIIALWALWGLAYTFTSGAEEAWITDEVGVEKVGGVFLRGSRIQYIGAVTGVFLQVAIGVYSLKAGVIAGGAVTVLAGILCIFFMPETGFRRRPRAERGSALTELRTTAANGFRFAWAAPVILLLVGVSFFTGMSSEAFDRLKEAHFLRDIGLPAVGSLDPVVWFGIFWLAGMVLGFFATGRLIKRFEHGGRRVVTSWLFGLTVIQMAAMLVFALTGLVWLAIGAMLGVFLTRNLAGPLYTIWLNEQITDSSVRATVLSISGQADAIGQAAGGPVLGVIGNVWGIRAALTAGALVIAPALWLYGRAIAHQGREPELEELPATMT